MSFSPDFCVRQTETVFTKLGPWSLVIGDRLCIPLEGANIVEVYQDGVFLQGGAFNPRRHIYPPRGLV
jgi:hypothetical protein